MSLFEESFISQLPLISWQEALIRKDWRLSDKVVPQHIFKVSIAQQGMGEISQVNSRFVLTAQLRCKCLVRYVWDVSIDNVVIDLTWGVWINGLQFPISLWLDLPLTQCQKRHVPCTRAEVLFGPLMPHARWRKQVHFWHCAVSAVMVCREAGELQGAQPPADWGLHFSCSGQAHPTSDIPALRIPAKLCWVPWCFIELDCGFCHYCLGSGRIF